MSKVNKEQLKNIIRKEYVDILKEAKNNETYFNRVAYKHVVNNLIKEEILEENWQDRAVQRQVANWDSGDAGMGALGYGESWNDARRRQGMPEYLPQSVLQDDPENMSIGGQMDPDAAPLEAAPLDPKGYEVAGLFPQHLLGALETISTDLPAGDFKENFVDIGQEVFAQLESELGGMKSQDDIASLVLQVLTTVVGSFDANTGRFERAIADSMVG
jgi:hypothetical protein